MKNYIFSNTLKFDITNNKVNICNLDLNIIKDLKSQNGSDIYLGGGGEFAGWLLDKEMIDILKIKLNPLILGNGVPLFGSSIKKYSLSRSKNENYDHGLEVLTYSIEY
jgi:dihydrofolate reductase